MYEREAHKLNTSMKHSLLLCGKMSADKSDDTFDMTKSIDAGQSIRVLVYAYSRMYRLLEGASTHRWIACPTVFEE